MDINNIYFRAKRIDNEEWVYGFYVHLKNLHKDSMESHRIYLETDCGNFYPNWIEINPNTIGQFTGLVDKNGNELFEGDICKGHNILHPDRHLYEVAFDNGQFVLFDEDGIGWNIHIDYTKKVGNIIDYIEKVGNIYDNAELLWQFNYEI